METGEHIELAEKIINIASEFDRNEFDMTPYGLLVLDYAYYLRCNYFHAGKPLPLFNFESDVELKSLNIINELLKEFLDDNITKVFDGRLSPT